MPTVSLTEFRTTRKVVAHSGVSVSVLLQGAIAGLQPPWMWLTSSHGLGTWMDCRVEREREPAESKCAPSLLSVVHGVNHLCSGLLRLKPRSPSTPSLPTLPWRTETL